MLWHVGLYALAFGIVWMGAGLVVSSVSGLAKNWRISPFVLSFFLLGFLTSLPEIAVGLTAVANNDPGIYVGNLIGGAIVMFLLIIPTLGIFGNGVKLPKLLSVRQLFLVLATVLAPTLLISDQRLALWEATLLIFLYVALFIALFRTKVADLPKPQPPSRKIKQQQSRWLLVKIIAGMALLVWASNQIVDSTLFFAELIEISPFMMSLLVVSIGTNIPEFSIIFRAILHHERDIAFADYLGSASVNTLLIGGLTLIYGQDVLLPNHYWIRFTFIMVGLTLFFFFARSRRTLSRKESLVLLACYLCFLAVEVITLID